MPTSKLQIFVTLTVLGLLLFQVLGKYLLPTLLLIAAAFVMAIGATVMAIAFLPDVCAWLERSVTGTKWLNLVFRLTGVRRSRAAQEIPPIDMKAAAESLEGRVIGNQPAVESLFAILSEVRSQDQSHAERPHDIIVMYGPSGIGKLHAASEVSAHLLAHRIIQIVRPRDSSLQDADVWTDYFSPTGAIATSVAAMRNKTQSLVLVIDAAERMKSRCMDSLTDLLNARSNSNSGSKSAHEPHVLFILIVSSPEFTSPQRDKRDKHLLDATNWPPQVVARCRDVIGAVRMTNEERGLAVAAMMMLAFEAHGIRVESIAKEAIVEAVKLWIQHDNAIYLKETLSRIIDRQVKKGMAQPVGIPGDFFRS